jgi:hypothetical protein
MISVLVSFGVMRTSGEKHEGRWLSKMGALMPGDHCTGRIWKVVVTDHGRRFRWHLVSYMFESSSASDSIVVVRLSGFMGFR